MKKVLSVISKLSEVRNCLVVSFAILSPYHLKVKSVNFSSSYLEHVIQIDEFKGINNDNGDCVLFFYFDEED